uniref:Uncharacterized protein n=1 Tax=Plectus sambesii TaxID=2011161 RepID=A0A914WGL9_9BILA
MVGRLIAAFLLLHSVRALNYHCNDNKVLIVQNFGKDSIRMHCSHLDLCGYKDLKCRYQENMPRCNGTNTFVSHVVQATETGPVAHSCCSIEPLVPNHEGNECFVYHLPDSHSEDVQQQNDAETVVAQAPLTAESADDFTGYRLKLFLLKNKTPPKLIVQGIERQDEGFAVSICRLRCNPFPDNTLS